MTLFTEQITFQYKQLRVLAFLPRCESGGEGGDGPAGKEVTTKCVCVCLCDGKSRAWAIKAFTGWPWFVEMRKSVFVCVIKGSDA